MDTRRIDMPLPNLFTRLRRRAIVLMLYLSQAVIAFLMWEANTYGPNTPRWLALVDPAFEILFPLAGLVILVSAATLWLGTRMMANLTDRQADERQQMVRNRAFRYAYLITQVVLAVIGILTSLYASPRVAMGEHVSVEMSTVILVLVGIVWNMSVLPTVLVAWTEPDLPEEQAVGS